ncbi:MAG TPA: hypothetical protein VG010_08345 [Solirubrobacteraceae bacterium]|jgi:hypothetical protein|nr:hypothetical protein [Solirubrobacteraceae bacterium]
MALVGSLLVAVGPALAASPLNWASPVRADDQPPFTSPATITGVSCPSMGLCVAVDSVGDVLISTDPMGGAGAWNKTHVGEDFTGVSCPSASLCVAVDSEGDVITSTDPIGGSGAWTKTQVVPVFEVEDIAGEEIEASGNRLEAVSCPSKSLCVATDAHGDVLSSADPTGGASAWTRTKVTTPNELGGGDALGGVSCPSVRLCVATASEGKMVSSTDPTGDMGAWSETDVDGTNNLSDVSCVSESLCVASDNSGSVLTATDPTGGEGAWRAARVDGHGSIAHVSCASWGLCVALDSNEIITSIEPAEGASAWTAVPIDVANKNGGQYSLESAACPSAELCVLGDAGGAVVASTEPAKGASAWTVSNLEVGSSALRGVSCAPAGVCVAVDEAGNIVASTDPTGGPGVWSEAHVDEHGLDGVSCPSARLCVAVDNAGEVLTSTDPMGGAGAWSVSDVDGARPLKSVSCPSVSLCVAIDEEGGLVTSTDPTGGVGAWSVTEMGSSFGFLKDLSCPSVSLCVAVERGNVMTLTEPGEPTGRVWAVTPMDEEALGVSCPSEALCVIVGQRDGVLSSTDPTGGTGAWNTTYVEGLNGLVDVSCGTVDLCVATSYGLNGSRGNVIASTDPTGSADAWSETEVYGGLIFKPDPILELYAEDLTGVSCARYSCVVIDTKGNVMVGTQSAPRNSSLPVASGAPAPGQTLSCANGSWTGYPPPMFTYQWLRDGTPISGASTSAYVVQSADEGYNLACQVTASNSAGSESATSDTLQVPAVQTRGCGGSGGGSSAGGGNPGTPTGTVSNAFVLNGMESVARHGTVRITLTLPGPGTLQIVGRASVAQRAGASRTKKKRTTTMIARLRLTISRAGRIVVTLAPTASAKAVLARRGKLKATITITYTPIGGPPRSIVRSLTFRLKRRS